MTNPAGPPPPPRQATPDDPLRDKMCDAIEALIADAFKTSEGQPVYEPNRSSVSRDTTSILFMPPATHRPAINVGFEVTLTYPAQLSNKSNG